MSPMLSGLKSSDSMKLYSKEGAAALVASMVRRDKICRSLILVGDRGVGKRTLAGYIAMQLLCERQNGVPCGECKSCRMAQKNAHPDIIWVSPSGKSENFRVDDLRPVVSDVSVAPNEGRLKIYIIPGIDKALAAAQNILLKVFEEPPPHVAFIMTAEEKDKVLETIRSRAIAINVPLASEKDCIQALADNGIMQDKAELAYAVCGGNIGKCIEYARSDGEDAIARVKALAQALAKGDEYALGKSLYEQDRESAQKLIRQVSALISDACLIKQGVKPESCFKEEAGLIASQVRLSGLVAMYDCAREAIAKLSGNCSVPLTCQDFAARLAGLSA